MTSKTKLRRKPTKKQLELEFSRAFHMLDEVSRLDYGLSFNDLSHSKAGNEKIDYLIQLTGVSLKRSYSLIKPQKSGKVGHRWVIDETLLSAKPETDWEFRTLALVGRSAPRQSGKGVARELKRETVIGKAFLRGVHGYLCMDTETKKHIEELTKNIPDAVNFSTPTKVLQLGGGALFHALLLCMPMFPSAAIAVIAVVILDCGLKTLCAKFEGPKAIKGTTKSSH